MMTARTSSSSKALPQRLGSAAFINLFLMMQLAVDVVIHAFASPILVSPLIVPYVIAGLC